MHEFQDRSCIRRWLSSANMSTCVYHLYMFYRGLKPNGPQTELPMFYSSTDSSTIFLLSISQNPCPSQLQHVVSKLGVSSADSASFSLTAIVPLHPDATFIVWIYIISYQDMNMPIGLPDFGIALSPIHLPQCCQAFSFKTF